MASVSKTTEAAQAGMSGVKLGRKDVGSTGDLLKQIEGVDGLLTKGVQLRWLGRLGATASSAALAALAKYHAPSWGLAIAAAGLAVSGALVSQGREWIKSSRQPFRYTFSVAPFEPASNAEADGEEAEALRRACDWIRADLILMLSDRIRRLSVLPEEQIPPDTPDRPASHIHVSGTYGSRTKNGEKTIELMPLVRIGSSRCSATVAFWVRQTSSNSEERDLTQNRVAYDQILERLYFSVATQIYKQIRLDVARKISRLPTQYLRATAYFYEAEDYAGSNTLDAFDDAGKLYTKALDLYDRLRRPLPEHAWQRPLQSLLRALAPRWRNVARRLAWVWPRFGRRPVQIARAETGRAKALLFRNVLANLSGREPQRVFEARRLVREAIEELERLPDGVEGLTEAKFEAKVVAAFADQWALDFETAKERLAEAEDLWPEHRQALFPFVSAGVEPRLQRKVRLLRRAVELDPRFEIAVFEIAFNLEQLWRTGDELESEGGRLVEAAYLDVIRMNPANITAWANLGYVRWLMWDSETDGDDVAQPFRDGRRYKEIRQKTFVAELDYGLARVAAERGDIAKAYEHYINASGATMAQEATSGYIAYCFDRVNEAILGRFQRYKDRVLEVIERESQQERSHRPPDRILNSVKAFALTDWGNAAAAFYRRSGDVQYREEARAAFEEALELNPRALVALRSRADLYSSLEDDPTALESAKRDLEALLEHEPRWAPGQLELVSTELALAEQAVAQAAADRRTVATDVENAVQKLFGFDGVLPASWLRRAQEIERLSKLDRRQTDAILDAVTGPTAPRAFTLRARANALSDDMQAAARHLCLFLEAHFLPSDYDLRRLLLRLAEAATEQDVAERLEDLRKRLRDIVIRKVESDPPHYYWLQKLDGELEVPKQERTRLLRTAVTWPGAPAHSLRFVADELEQLGEHEWSENARERAKEKERLAVEQTHDLAAALVSAPRGLPDPALLVLDEVWDPGITRPLLLPEVVEEAESLEAYWSLAASLVVMSIHLSGDGRLFEGLEDDECRIARQIELPALESQMRLDDVVDSLAFVNLGVLGDQLAAARPDVDDRRLKLAHERLVTLLGEQPEPSLALGLMVVNLFHPVQLVRVAAAAALAPLIADPPKLVEETLAEGTRSEFETIRQLGANALTHVSPRHRALREIIEGVEEVDRPVAPAHTSTTIHGTWARFRSNWWKPEGRLHTYLLAKVSRDLYAEPDHYRWDGRYGQGARESAAEDLKTWAERHDVDEFDVVYAHSHGGNVALEAALRGVPIRLLILLSVPARHRSKDDWRKIWSNVRRSISIRSRLDLVVLADRSPLRFPDKVRELALPGLWFGHDLILQPATWDDHKLANEVLYERSLT